MTTIHYGHPNWNKMEINIMTYSDTIGASTWTGTGATGVTGGAGSIEPGGKVKFNLFLDIMYEVQSRHSCCFVVKISLKIINTHYQNTSIHSNVLLNMCDGTMRSFKIPKTSIHCRKTHHLIFTQ
jgi:hypothetical protein